MRLLLFLFPVLAIPVRSVAQLAAGPMVGHVAMREATIWLQTDGPGQEVMVTATPEGETGAVPIKAMALASGPYDGFTSVPLRADIGISDSRTGHVLKFALVGLRPGQHYEYQIHVNGELLPLDCPARFTTQSLWQHRTDPPGFSFLAGSCAYVNEEAYDRPGKPYGGDYGIFAAMDRENADMMLWLGDNTYLREADWNSRSGILHRFAHSRALKEAQPLLARMPNYAIWDDHDHGPNDSDRSYPLRQNSLEAFNLFWANPGSGATGLGGITTSFRFNDCDFFLLDNRWFRSAPDSTGQILGQAQILWLIEALRFSDAPFKFVCVGGQVLNTAAVYENHAVFAKERRRLLHLIDSLHIRNVVFMSGDRHHSEVSRYTGPNGTVIHDLTISPLTSRASDKPKQEVNLNQMQGSYIAQRNFGLLSISGPRKARQLTLVLKDVDGKELYSFVLKQ